MRIFANRRMSAGEVDRGNGSSEGGTTETGAGTALFRTVPASRRYRQRSAVVGAVALASAVACGAGATAIASAASTRAQQSFGSAARTAVDSATAALLPGQSLMPAGKVGTRSQVPWGVVGSGWALAEFTAGTGARPKPVTLCLIDPAGGRYRMYQWPAGKPGWRLLDWSGDKTRALFASSSNGYVNPMHQIVLATGKVSAFSLPAAVQPIGYTKPTGTDILAIDNGIVRYSLTGAFQARLIKGPQWNTKGIVSSPDGATVAMPGAGNGLVLVSNTGGIVRRLHVRAGWCQPVRWWGPGTLLASCDPAGAPGPQLWRVPVSGASPSAVTPIRTNQGPDLGDLDAWQMDGGRYVQALGACSTIFIGKQAANGSVKTVSVPGSHANNIVAGTNGRWMLVEEAHGCAYGVALVWFDPGSRAVRHVLSAGGGYGVLALVLYNGNGDQPAYLP